MPPFSRSVVRSLFAAAAVIALGAAAQPKPSSKTSPPAAKSGNLPAPVLAAGRAIEAARLETDVRALADDSMEGRGTATRGYDLAARYVAERMQALGLAPGGQPSEKGPEGFLQPVPFLRGDLQIDACSFELHRPGAKIAFEVGRDVLLSPDYLRTKWTVEAPLVFAGYGVSAPELNYDDFAGLDVRGKVLVTFRGAPPRFPANERAYYSNGLIKDQMAAARGAIGHVQITKPDDEARAPWARNMRQNRLPGFRWTDDGGAPSNTQAGIELAASLSPEAERRVFEGSDRTYEQAVTDAESSLVRSALLPWTVKSTRVTRHARASSPNVVGVLRGSDPKLRDECVVISAHLDHLGVGEPVNGDSIHNGAYDNATGTAMLLETARAFASLKVRPKRSVVFLSVTGEEKGLQGSDYFARHSAPDSMDVVANVNLDMVLMLRPIEKVVAIGAQHSTLGAVMERAAAAAGLELVPDPMPQEVVFIRSDQFSFVKQGVPAVFPVSGNDGSSSGREEVGHWRVDHYHSPNDDLSQTFDWPSGARFASMAFWAAWIVADTPAPPRWHPGDFFGTRFGARP